MSKAGSEHITFITLVFTVFSIWSYSKVENDDYQVKEHKLDGILVVSEPAYVTPNAEHPPEVIFSSTVLPKTDFSVTLHYKNSELALTIPLTPENSFYSGVIQDLQNFKYSQNRSATDRKPDFPVPATGCSQNHEIEVKKHLKNIISFLKSDDVKTKFNPVKKLIVWNLQKQKKSDHADFEFGKDLKVRLSPIFINSGIELEIRDFPFPDYPTNVQDMHHYSWKVIINTKMILEFGSLWWFDSSIAVKTDKYLEFTEIVYKALVKDKSCFLFAAPGASHDYISRTCQTTMKYLEPENNIWNASFDRKKDKNNLLGRERFGKTDFLTIQQELQHVQS